ncbi:immunoglobulin-like domain-containing protein, partial [Pseudomonas sp. 147P]|uniref:immunoglobulin-like domain-containing protein n=1 Tax=Pseudomonas ulcerans TaxID=3115852 RepID=UPI002E7B27B2
MTATPRPVEALPAFLLVEVVVLLAIEDELGYVYVDGGNVSVTITGTTGGDFEHLEVSPTAAVTAVTDSIDTSTVTLTATASAVEGGVVTYVASVTSPVTGTPLVISLANGQSITIPVNASSGSVDFIAPNNVLNTNTPLTNSITGVTGGNYEHL